MKDSVKKFSDCMLNQPPVLYLGKQSNLKLMSQIINDIIQYSETEGCKLRDNADIKKRGYFTPKDFLIKSLTIISNNLSDGTFDYNRFASDMCISKSTLYRLLHSLTGISPWELILYTRLRYAQLYLSDTSLQIAEVAIKVGFNCPKYFSRCFRNQFGSTPKAYREKITLMLAGEALHYNDKLLIEKATKLITNNISNTNYKINHLAIEFGLSNSTLYRRIKTITGLSPVIFMRTVKLNHAKSLLRHNSGDVLDIAYASGFSDAKYFSKCFRSEFGILPKEIIKYDIFTQNGW